MRDDMPIPKQGELEVPILEILEQAGGEANPQQVYPQVAARFGLSSDEKNVPAPGDPKSPHYIKNIQWAKQKLVRKGEVDASRRGIWKITDNGRARLGIAPPGVSQPSTTLPAEVQSGGFPAEIRSELRSLVQEIKALAASDSGHRPSEADTRALFIDRYLRLLGYVGFEDTRREYFIKNLKEYIDYLLYVDGVPAIAVEAKALGNDLTEPMAAQLIKYAAIEGIEWCVLTNGRQVFVYNQYLKGPVPDKLVLKLDLLVADAGQNLDQTIARLWLLSKESMRANALTSYMDQVRLDRSIREVLLEPGSAATGALKSSLLERFGLRVSEDAITGWLREHLGGV